MIVVRLVRLIRSVTFVMSLGCCFTCAFAASRFDFSKNLWEFERSSSHYGYQRLDPLSLSEDDLKEYRWRQIGAVEPDIKNYYYPEAVYLTILFDVTDVAGKAESNERNDLMVGAYLEAVRESLSVNMEIHFNLYYSVIRDYELIVDSSNNRKYRKMDLLIDQAFVYHLIQHPKFEDIIFTGVSEGIIFKEEYARFSQPLKEKEYSHSLMRQGYYLEVKEAFVDKVGVNVHVELYDEVLLDDVLQQLETIEYKLLGQRGSEFLATITERTARILFDDKRVKWIKDYEYHHDIGVLKHGRWEPNPLSDLRLASEEEIIQIDFYSRLNKYGEETHVIKSQRQLNNFFKKLSFYENDKELKKIIKRLKINFTRKRLILFSKDESSGSVGFRQKPPIWVDGKLVVRIDHSVPEIRTADLAQHFFGYIVDKSIPEVMFRLGSQEVVVKND